MTDNKEILVREQQEADREELVQRAKELYMRYWTLPQISKQLDINYGTLKKWVTRYGWHPEREEAQTDASVDAIKARSVETAEIMRDGLEAIRKTIEKYKKADSMDMKDAVALSNVLTNIDKLMRLAEGKATDISESRELKANLTASTVVDVIQNKPLDPFLVEALKDLEEEEEEGNEKEDKDTD